MVPRPQAQRKLLDALKKLLSTLHELKAHLVTQLSDLRQHSLLFQSHISMFTLAIHILYEYMSLRMPRELMQPSLSPRECSPRRHPRVFKPLISLEPSFLHTSVLHHPSLTPSISYTILLLRPSRTTTNDPGSITCLQWLNHIPIVE